MFQCFLLIVQHNYEVGEGGRGSLEEGGGRGGGRGGGMGWEEEEREVGGGGGGRREVENCEEELREGRRRGEDSEGDAKAGGRGCM